MGREVRMVAPGWEHPKNDKGRYIGLYNRPWYPAFVEWREEKRHWDDGERRDYATGGWKPRDADTRDMPYEDWNGAQPDHRDYMPEWPAGVATMFMMYEDTSEGTPISPAFATPEELARWLADNNASAFGDMTAPYEHWLRVARGGYAPSMVVSGGVMQSGVSALTESDHA